MDQLNGQRRTYFCTKEISGKFKHGSCLLPRFQCQCSFSPKCINVLNTRRKTGNLHAYNSQFTHVPTVQFACWVSVWYGQVCSSFEVLQGYNAQLRVRIPRIPRRPKHTDEKVPPPDLQTHTSCKPDRWTRYTRSGTIGHEMFQHLHILYYVCR